MLSSPRDHCTTYSSIEVRLQQQHDETSHYYFTEVKEEEGGEGEGEGGKITASSTMPAENNPQDDVEEDRIEYYLFTPAHTIPTKQLVYELLTPLKDAEKERIPIIAPEEAYPPIQDGTTLAMMSLRQELCKQEEIQTLAEIRFVTEMSLQAQGFPSPAAISSSLPETTTIVLPDRNIPTNSAENSVRSHTILDDSSSSSSNSNSACNSDLCGEESSRSHHSNSSTTCRKPFVRMNTNSKVVLEHPIALLLST